MTSSRYRKSLRKRQDRIHELIRQAQFPLAEWMVVNENLKRQLLHYPEAVVKLVQQAHVSLADLAALDLPILTEFLEAADVTVKLLTETHCSLSYFAQCEIRKALLQDPSKFIENDKISHHVMPTHLEEIIVSLKNCSVFFRAQQIELDGIVRQLEKMLMLPPGIEKNALAVCTREALIDCYEKSYQTNTYREGVKLHRALVVLARLFPCNEVDPIDGKLIPEAQKFASIDGYIFNISTLVEWHNTRDFEWVLDESPQLKFLLNPLTKNPFLYDDKILILSIAAKHHLKIKHITAEGISLYVRSLKPIAFQHILSAIEKESLYDVVTEEVVYRCAVTPRPITLIHQAALYDEEFNVLMEVMPLADLLPALWNATFFAPNHISPLAQLLYKLPAEKVYDIVKAYYDAPNKTPLIALSTTPITLNRIFYVSSNTYNNLLDVCFSEGSPPAFFACLRAMPLDVRLRELQAVCKLNTLISSRENILALSELLPQEALLGLIERRESNQRKFIEEEEAQARQRFFAVKRRLTAPKTQANDLVPSI